MRTSEAYFHVMKETYDKFREEAKSSGFSLKNYPKIGEEGMTLFSFAPEPMKRKAIMKSSAVLKKQVKKDLGYIKKTYGKNSKLFKSAKDLLATSFVTHITKKYER